MKKKNLSLASIQVKSFTTSTNKQMIQTVKGKGDRPPETYGVQGHRPPDGWTRTDCGVVCDETGTQTNVGGCGVSFMCEC